MQLLIDGQMCELLDLRQFRAAHGLPDDFGVAHFEPKDFSGLASIDQAGTDLNRVRESVLRAIPDVLTPQDLLPCTDRLTQVFRTQLNAINARVHLKDVEIDFAVAGFGDFHRTLAYTLIRAYAGSQPIPMFDAVYQQWLDDSVRVSSKVHTYTYAAQAWRVQIINTAYGRAGLIIRHDTDTYYVRDGALACPAEGYMFTLMKESTHRIITAMNNPSLT